MAISLAAGVLYALIAFAAGFILGAIRVVLVAPAIGEMEAVLIEAPFILAISWVAARWSASKFAISAEAPSRLIMGAAAFAILMLAEFGLWIALGRAPSGFFASMATPAGVIGLLAQIAFAAFPLLQIWL